MSDLMLTILALVVSFIVLFLVVYLMVGITFMTIKWLKLAKNWLLPPFSDG